MSGPHELSLLARWRNMVRDSSASRTAKLVAYTLTFTKAGTYSYVCLVHPNMGGVVQVT